MNFFKTLAASLPAQFQNELKRIHFRRQIRRNQFSADEPEYEILHTLVSTGDWVIDIGGNVGHYTKKLSELTGATGRVIVFEPVPETFTLLAANVQNLLVSNVTLINAAASDKTELVGMNIPTFNTGLRNFYQAHISSTSTDSLQVLTISVDSLELEHTISLVKIDAEGHELSVLKGMYQLLLRDKPTLIIETDSPEVENTLSAIGYTSHKLNGSPNILFKH